MKTTDLSNIMRMAWQFYRTTRRAFAECLKIAWRNFNLVRRMHAEIVRFYYRKKNDTVQVYFDTEKNEWRCFKRLNLEIM